MTHQKALRINLNGEIYGTFAEIGAGQEVARWFFRVGGAAGTVAKTISAYDMNFSDAIYGPCERYVSRQRLNTMMDHEYQLLMERLVGKRMIKTRYFVFANTVTTRSYSRKQDGHGWMGIRFQHVPDARPSEIVIHVRMLDREMVMEQEALGIIGVNLISGAYYLQDQPEMLMASLLDELSADRIEVDMIAFSGPAFATVDNRIMSVKLVELGLSKAAMFTANGETIQPDEALYRRSILLERGSFRPITKLTVDMIQCATRHFISDTGGNDQNHLLLLEISLNNLLSEGRLDVADFLARVDMLGALGHTVMISSYGEYYRLVEYLFKRTQEKMGIALGMPNLQAIFDEQYYDTLEGGILEACGALFKNRVTLYVYPRLDPSQKLITADTYSPGPKLHHLYQHLLANKKIIPIQHFEASLLSITSNDVLRRISTGDVLWEKMVPASLVESIKKYPSFGYAK